MTNDNCAIKLVDNILYSLILLLLILSLFCSSNILGCIAFAIFCITVVKLFCKGGEKVEMNIFEKFLFIYILFVIISVASSTLLTLSLKGFLKTLTYLGFYFSAVQFFRKNINKIPLTILLMGLCAGFEGIIGFVQNFLCVEAISTWQDVTRINPEEVMTRVYGTLKPFNPNLYGGYLTSTIPCLFGMGFYFLIQKRYKFCISLLSLTLLSCISLIFSGCRGAYIGLFSMILLIAFFFAKYIWDNNNEKLKKIYTYSLVSIASITTFLALTITPIRTRIFSIFVMREDSSTSFRLNVYQSVLQMIKDNWLLGIGVGNQNFREIYGLYMRTGFDALSAYCIYLEIFVESGIFALLAFLAFLYFTIKCSLKYIFANINNYKKSIFMITALISVASICVHGLVDTIYFRPQVQFVFWTLISFISAILYQEKEFCE